MNDFSVTDECLKNKTILITGAGDGIGKVAALTYAEHGATVILLGKTVAKLEATYDDIVAKGYPEPAIVPLDMKGATAQNYKDMVNTIVEQLGHLDGALLNASILGELTPFTQISSQIWDDVMQVNLTAQMYLAQALIPALLKAEHGSLVFTTSGVGNQGRAFWGPYSISKFATEGMMQVIADEYEGSSLRVNAINPGATNTKMRQTAFPAEDKSKIASPNDIMPAYLYLMSDQSIGVTGQRINAQTPKA
ncbi:YciK family oxidoreductase [Thalassotalea ponticola]|uniref:YciK family oxidoreductase n=1 Tax=Thalassotalea ponticola TaxID=1523392 RepID=UPI0025B2E5AC|nr:YciK family oxidoreductase [Thalassotalea ponticola]MDN3651566.1 YciK family oxidoreductase [Thalassotalea ponticola]